MPFIQMHRRNLWIKTESIWPETESPIKQQIKSGSNGGLRLSFTERKQATPLNKELALKNFIKMQFLDLKISYKFKSWPYSYTVHVLPRIFTSFILASCLNIAVVVCIQFLSWFLIKVFMVCFIVSLKRKEKKVQS